MWGWSVTLDPLGSPSDAPKLASCFVPFDVAVPRVTGFIVSFHFQPLVAYYSYAKAGYVVPRILLQDFVGPDSR